MPQFTNNTNYVLYFIHDKQVDLYKIGTSSNLERRIKALKNKYHYGPNLVTILTKIGEKKIIRSLEKKILKKYKKNKSLRTMSVEHYVDNVKVGKKLIDQKMNGGTEWLKLTHNEKNNIKKLINDDTL